MQKMKRSALFFLALLMILCLGPAAFAKAPADLSVDYSFVQGGPVQAATLEKYTLQAKSLQLKTDYIPTEFGSDPLKRIQNTKIFKVSDEQLDALWQIIQKSQFMTWPATQAERPPQSGNQVFRIVAEGKNASHSMWDAGQKDQFIQFSRDFLNWAKQVMRAQF